MLSTLAESDDSLVLEVCASGGCIGISTFARFRNGDINAGLALIGSQPIPGTFLPGITFLDLEHAALAFGRVHENRRKEFVEWLSRVPTDRLETVRCLLILMGYMAWAELTAPASRMWQESSDAAKLAIRSEFIWVIGRCGAGSARDELWQALRMSSDKFLLEGARPVRPTFFELQHAWERWCVAPSAVDEFVRFFLENYNRDPNVGWLLKTIDLPQAVECSCVIPLPA